MKTKRKIKLSFNSIKAIIGSLLIIAGILSGIYVGFWIMFIGGIMGIANAYSSY